MQSSHEYEELLAIRWHWGESYRISYQGGAWTAQRLDDLAVILTANTVDGLYDLIHADYRRRPVPRDADGGAS